MFVVCKFRSSEVYCETNYVVVRLCEFVVVVFCLFVDFLFALLIFNPSMMFSSIVLFA